MRGRIEVQGVECRALGVWCWVWAMMLHFGAGESLPWPASSSLGPCRCRLLPAKVTGTELGFLHH